MINVESEVVLSNIGVKQLIKHAIQNGEGKLSSSGAFSTETGKRTGRSPLDRFIVQDNLTDKTVDWGDINRSISQGVFSTLWSRALSSIQARRHYVSDLQVGQETQYALPVKVITELAWHNAFCCHMFVEQDAEVSRNKQEWTILNSVSTVLNGKEDGVNSDGAVIINLSERKVLLCGMRYAGEMKKAMFTVLNYFLPDEQVLPMHCASNMGDQGDVALFFGLSGTGKTTLSADPQRCLIGDDEHGWSDQGVFNFEGGCYAKCINLTIEREPVIWNAITQDCIMENVVLKQGGYPDFSDDSLTQNSRAAYPRYNIKKRVLENKGRNPKTVLFLTCDLYGVLPPVSLINKFQAAYYFLSGYTALVGSTEVGGKPGVHPTFSTCFGAPFFPRPVGVYAELLLKHVEANQSQVYLINTGWKGGSYGEGERFSIPDTRRVVAAAVSGELLAKDNEIYPGFGFEIPKNIDGLNPALLDPRKVWENSAQLKEKTNHLISLFQENFERFESLDPRFIKAGPTLIQ